MSENGAPAIPTLQKQEVKPVLPKRSYSSPSLHFHHSPVYGDPPLRALRAEGIKGARTDDELVEAIMDRKHDTVFVKYGLPWCKSCKAVLPEWVTLTQEFDRMDYVIASVENMKEAIKDIHYTPHFAVFRKGRLVDEFHGTDLQRLRDRMWLHNGD